ncbi:thioredoxin family protein [Salipaludibacillus sp. CUR1]|uniref:thioredoxin family protein n=1 Tax=Salipaludibacillus sp. CUR1 TaxID=2820003 RepID=UPI001E5888ED|nr:thioredoxin family protein [Salipaludibacillus sp. CUR1]MCE7791640.1 thioredoxin family protein [Salipaludibacillus sp. CUR1]
MENVQTISQIKERLSREEIVILLIKSENCSVCDAIENQIKDGAIKDYSVPVIKAKLEDAPEISGEFLTFTSPTILLFINNKEHWRASRFIPFDDLNKHIDFWKT